MATLDEPISNINSVDSNDKTAGNLHENLHSAENELMTLRLNDDTDEGKFKFKLLFYRWITYL